MGLRATDDELRDELQHGQLGIMLFPDGKFVGQEEYENFAQRNDMTVPQFEARRKDLFLSASCAPWFRAAPSWVTRRFATNSTAATPR
jgi:hypothetical protein